MDFRQFSSNGLFISYIFYLDNLGLVSLESVYCGKITKCKFRAIYNYSGLKMIQ